MHRIRFSWCLDALGYLSYKLFGVGLLLLLGACTQMDRIEQEGSDNLVSAPVLSKAAYAVPHPGGLIDTPLPPVSGLNQTLLVALLTAELAGQKHWIDIALEIYLELTFTTQHPALAERATWIAQYAQQPHAALDAALVWASQAPDQPEAQRLAAGLLLQNEQYLDAMPFLVRFEQLGGHSNYSLLAQHFIERQQTGVSELYHLLKQAPLNHLPPAQADRATALALLSHEMNDQPTTQNHLQHALTLAPHFVPAVQLQAKILRQGRNYEAAQTQLYAALNHQADDVTLWLELVRTQLLAGDLSAAEYSVNALLALQPDQPQVYLALARIQLEAHQYERASETLYQLTRYPDSADQAWWLLGQLAERERKTQRALDYYRQIENGQPLLEASLALLRLLPAPEHTPEILAFLRLKQRQQPTFGLELTLIGEQRLRAEGRYQAALDWLEAGYAEQPELARMSDFIYSRAINFYFLDQLEAMETTLRHLLQLEPYHAQALNALGYTLVDRTSRLHEGLLLIQRAHALDAESPEILDSLGWAMYRLGRYEEAREYLEEAYARLPDEEIGLHLVQTLLALADKTTAQELLTELEQRFPASPEWQQLRERLTDINIESPTNYNKSEADI